MTLVRSPNGTEASLRVIVFKDGDVHVAQLLEYDISVQAEDMSTLFERLDLTLQAEFAMRGCDHGNPFHGIAPAQNHFEALWSRRTSSSSKLSIDLPDGILGVELGFAKAA